jgi:CPA2 family monovalent cation:H+ antiporter-2
LVFHKIAICYVNTMDYKLDIVLLLTVGFAFACLFGAIASRFKLPPILGYLIAGFAIGPFSPGFVADLKTSEQLAEIGVVLMLFGVGLHFKLEDLLNVRRIAIPGALGQTLVASAAGTYFVWQMGWPIENGLIIGLAISVASTVVLVRVLSDNNQLETSHGHIAVGWLIVEDILTVAMLVLLPALASFKASGEASILAVSGSILFFLGKFVLLVFLVVGWGYKAVSYVLTYIARFRSQELFTLTVLALTFVIATGSTALFGTSIALGAFLAGIVIGQTDVRHQAFANALPLKDMFAVLFFLSIGMLFDPAALVEHFFLFAGLLAIILLVKPLAAYAIVVIMGYPIKTALVVAVALAQIGEFSFILAEQSIHWKLIPDEGYDLLVACAFVSISINPLLFEWMLRYEEKWSKFCRLNNKKIKGYKTTDAHLFEKKADASDVIVVGFGPIGQDVTQALEEQAISPAIIEHNIDTALKTKNETRNVIYGDARTAHMLQVTAITEARLLVITVPEIATTVSVIKSARHLQPDLRILARIHYLSEKALMEKLGVDYICAEEEVSKAFVEKVMKIVG